MRTKAILAAGCLLAMACRGAGGGGGDSYPVRPDSPWGPAAAASGEEGGDVAAKADGGAKGDPRKGSADAAKPEDGKAAPKPPAAPRAGEPTVLEQLETARARIAGLEKDNQLLSAELASTKAVLESVRRDNSSLTDVGNQIREQKQQTEKEIAALRDQAKEAELRARSLADDLLAERIQRVRAERALILAKVAEAQGEGAGQ